MILQLWAYILRNFSSLVKYTTLIVNSNASEVWVMIMCQCRITGCNKCATLVGDVDNGGGYAYVGIGNRWEISVSFTQ
jgi:hypothetical protein